MQFYYIVSSHSPDFESIKLVACDEAMFTEFGKPLAEKIARTSLADLWRKARTGNCTPNEH